MTKRAVLLLLACVAVGGCASTQKLPDGYSLPEPLPPEIAEAFCYEPRPVENSLVLDKQKSRVDVYLGELEPSLDMFDDDSKVTFEYYRRNDGGPAPVVILMPILNGQKHFMRPFANHFVKHGYAAVIIDTTQRNTLLEDLQNAELALRQSIMRHRRVIDWIEAQEELDADRIAVFGASLGGFNALYLAALDERVDAVLAGLAAGDLPFIFVNSKERRIREASAGLQQQLTLDEQGVFEYLQENIRPDTLDLARHMNADRVMLVQARYDKKVPTEKQIELQQTLGYPETIVLPTGHDLSAAYIFYLASRARKFFDQKLAEQDGPGTALLPPDVCLRQPD